MTDRDARGSNTRREGREGQVRRSSLFNSDSARQGMERKKRYGQELKREDDLRVAGVGGTSIDAKALLAPS